MPTCEIKTSKKVKLCTGDMKDKVSIVSRVISAPSIGSISPTTTFTELLAPWAIVETITESAAKYFSGVNTKDRPTHKVLIFFDSTIWPLDMANNFIEINDRRFRVTSAKDLNEMHETIEILCTDRGLDTMEATKA